MGKINIDTQTEPTETPGSGTSFIYVDSADDRLTNKADDATINKYLLSESKHSE